MGDKTGIEWTDATWNPVTGCSKVSQGCKNCYAEREWPRLVKLVPSYAGRAFTDVRTHPERLVQPLRWKKPRRIFVNSMSDLFHPDVPDDFIDCVFAVMALAPQHTFQILTKRPTLMREYLSGCVRRQVSVQNLIDNMETWDGDFIARNAHAPLIKDWPLPNVWLGVSVEDQETANERIQLLLQTPAAVRWVSLEPLLGPVTLMHCEHPNYSIPADYLSGQDSRSGADAGTIDWVVVGGESGPNARPMHPQWVRDLRVQCEAFGAPFLFKQWGEWAPYDRGAVDSATLANPQSLDDPMILVGKKRAGRLLDGVQHDGYPAVAA